VLALLFALTIAPTVAYLLWDMGQVGKFAFKLPWALLLLLSVRSPSGSSWSSAADAPRASATPRPACSSGCAGGGARLAPLPSVLRVVAIALCAIALARPQTRDRGSRVEVEGIDIVVALDMSNSMEASDSPRAVSRRPRSWSTSSSPEAERQIGLVVFGASLHPVPAHARLLGAEDDARGPPLGLIDGTATAIATRGRGALELRGSDAKSRVVICSPTATTTAQRHPIQAARYAQAMRSRSSRS